MSVPAFERVVMAFCVQSMDSTIQSPTHACEAEITDVCKAHRSRGSFMK